MVRSFGVEAEATTGGEVAMGCGSSIVADSPPQAVETLVVGAVRTSSLAGKLVHVVGYVTTADGTALHSPFAEEAGVAVVCQFFMPRHTMGMPAIQGPERLLFRGRDMLDFKIVSGKGIVAKAK